MTALTEKPAENRLNKFVWASDDQPKTPKPCHRAQKSAQFTRQTLQQPHNSHRGRDRSTKHPQDAGDGILLGECRLIRLVLVGLSESFAAMYMHPRPGGVAEWSNALVLKTSEGESLPWVRIPPPPPPTPGISLYIDSPIFPCAILAGYALWLHPETRVGDTNYLNLGLGLWCQHPALRFGENSLLAVCRTCALDFGVE